LTWRNIPRRDIVDVSAAIFAVDVLSFCVNQYLGFSGSFVFLSLLPVL
jgi:hypothetical protein